MQTDFSPQQLADPGTAIAEGAIRKCVHCGFCTATCPTYVLLGNELDSPRGRIMLMKDMLENERVPDAGTVRHIDRCLSCLSCRTTCPSGVDYMHLVDHARQYVETRYRRPFGERVLRRLLALVLPHPVRVTALLRLAPLGRPFAPLLARFGATRPLAAMLELAPRRLPRQARPSGASAAAKGEVVVLRGCVEQVLQPQVRAATARVLARLGYGIREIAEEGCCGSLVLHLGQAEAAREAARRNIDAWWPAVTDGVVAIVVTASGCGLAVKDYGHLLAGDPAYADKAQRVSALARDGLEFLAEIGLPARAVARPLRIAWHPPCSLQHGQRLGDVAPRLLRALGHTVEMPRDAHLCCGSAGTYNILQPEIAGQLGERKVAALAALAADVVATANIGCAVQIARGSGLPVVHAIELVDAALGGPDPVAHS